VDTKDGVPGIWLLASRYCEYYTGVVGAPPLAQICRQKGLFHIPQHWLHTQSLPPSPPGSSTGRTEGAGDEISSYSPSLLSRLPRSDLRRPARGMGLVLSAALADRDQVHERRGAPGAVPARGALLLSQGDVGGMTDTQYTLSSRQKIDVLTEQAIQRLQEHEPEEGVLCGILRG